MITKIVTARGTDFIVGCPHDYREDSPAVQSIEQTEGYSQVNFDDGTFAYVTDVVESWHK